MASANSGKQDAGTAGTDREPESPSEGTNSSELAGSSGGPAQDEATERQHHIIASWDYSGPLPPPELLARYDDVCSGGAERIFRQFEKQSEHRQAMERQVLNAEQDRQRADAATVRLGQVFAFLIVIAFGAGAMVCILLATTGAQAAAGASLAGASLAGIVAAFIYGHRAQREARQGEDDAS